MNKKLKITLIVVGIVLFLLILSGIGAFSSLNKCMNKLIAGAPDKSCNTNSDCTLRKTTCNPCDCGSAVNKDWKRFCPLPTQLVYCSECMSLGYDSEIKCINNLCQTIPLNK